MTYSENIQFQIDTQLQSFETAFGKQTDAQLAKTRTGKEWNAIECIQHLNLTFVHYIPLMQKGISKAAQSGQSPSEQFNPGFFGERMARMMRPKDGTIRMPVRTFGKFNPSKNNGLAPQAVMTQFRTYMGDLRQLAENSQQVNLGKVRITSAVGPILKLKLGDTFPFLLAHNERHLLQAQRALQNTAGMPTSAH